MTDKTEHDIEEEKPTAVADASAREGLNASPNAVDAATGKAPMRCAGCGARHSGHHRTRSRRTYYLSGLFCRTCSLDGERAWEAEQSYDRYDDDALARHAQHDAEHVAAGRLEPR